MKRSWDHRPDIVDPGVISGDFAFGPDKGNHVGNTEHRSDIPHRAENQAPSLLLALHGRFDEDVLKF